MRFRSAFSLVELSIVLVILGLLVGGVLSGKSLIHAAELRAVTTDMSKFLSASLTFRDKYFMYPGDITNATAFWGSAGGTGNDSACDTAISLTNKAVCNGDGDGWIDTSSTAGVFGNERAYGWKDLGNAGLIEGSYSGKSLGWSNVPGRDVPKARLSNVYPTFAYVNMGNVADIYLTRPSNVIFWGAASNTSGLTTQDAWNVDVKLDDGKPNTGIVFTTTHTSTVYTSWVNCTDASTPPLYNLSNSDAICLMDIAIL